MHRVLVPVDGSAASERLADALLGLREWYREPLEVHLLNVQQPIASGTVKMFISRTQIEDYLREEGIKALAGARARLDAAGVPCQHHIGIGDAAEIIAAYAREKSCRQIVMSTRGLGGVAGALLGSVASGVLRLAEVPVTFIK